MQEVCGTSTGRGYVLLLAIVEWVGRGALEGTDAGDRRGYPEVVLGNWLASWEFVRRVTQGVNKPCQPGGQNPDPRATKKVAEVGSYPHGSAAPNNRIPEALRNLWTALEFWSVAAVEE